MSGRRIDDHGFWAGGKSKGSVFPEGVHHKEESSAEGAGHVGSMYGDTSEMIKSQQEMSIGKLKSHPPKAGHRYQ